MLIPVHFSMFNHSIDWIHCSFLKCNYFIVCSCVKCPKKFHEKRTLTAHQLRHLEDEKRSFECHQCHKRFSRQHILNRHLSDVHPIGDPKFICHICEKKWVTPGRISVWLHTQIQINRLILNGFMVYHNSFKSDHILKMHVLKVHDRIDQRICDVVCYSQTNCFFFSFFFHF